MKFKESPLVKNHKILTGTKRDMRKKVVKSTTPTSDLKKPTTLKRQLGGNIFTTYNSIAPYEGPTFEQPLATIEIEELPVNRLEANRRQVMAKAEEPKQEPVEEPVNTEPLPTSKEEKTVKETPKAAPTQIKTKDEFVKTMTPAFENALKAKGLDTKYAKYLVAQSALESNWGRSQSGKFNFGGIKGKGTTRRTREVVNGQSVYINDSFRDFKDIDDYANYHVSLLNNKRYNAFTGDFIDRVVKGGYATDPKYRQALSNVYNQIAKAQVGMKIPKLQNAGELKTRILRRFRQEKLDAHNEELIGFDWSRYKSYKPKPEARTPVTPQSEQLENGGVIKAQDGIVAKAINKVKSILPKEEPKEPVDVVDIIKEYAPSAATSFLSGSVNPFINKLLEGKKPSLDYSHKFGSTGNKFEEFASVMTPIFKEALEENGLPTTNLNNLVRQAALESNYGLDPRGERGFNLSGIKHPGDKIAPKYKKSRYKDGFDYIDFDDLKSYASYKVKVLNDRYKALDAKDTGDFINRLHGSNPGKYNYSADKDSYKRNLTGTLSLNRYLYQKGGSVLRSDNTNIPKPEIPEAIERVIGPSDRVNVPAGTRYSDLTSEQKLKLLTSDNLKKDKPLEIVSPEFDILTGIRSLATLPKGFLKGTGKIKVEPNKYYRQVNRVDKGIERAKALGVIDTKQPTIVQAPVKGIQLQRKQAFEVPFFSKDNLWYGRSNKFDVIVGKDSKNLEWMPINKHGRFRPDLKNAEDAYVRTTPLVNGQSNKAPASEFEFYRHYPGLGQRNVTNGFPHPPVTGLDTSYRNLKEE